MMLHLVLSRLSDVDVRIAFDVRCFNLRAAHRWPPQSLLTNERPRPATRRRARLSPCAQLPAAVPRSVVDRSICLDRAGPIEPAWRSPPFEDPSIPRLIACVLRCAPRARRVLLADHE